MLTIREMVPADLDDVATIHARSWRVAYRGLVSDAFLDAIDPVDWAFRYRNRTNSPTLLALADGAPVGFASYGPDREGETGGEVYAIYLVPEAQGRGIGRALLDAAVGRLAAPVRLWCAAGNAASRRFYEAYGFHADGATGSIEVDGRPLATVRYTLGVEPGADRHGEQQHDE